MDNTFVFELSRTIVQLNQKSQGQHITTSFVLTTSLQSDHCSHFIEVEPEAEAIARGSLFKNQNTF